jgi:putative addiction module CopG family antidote
VSITPQLDRFVLNLVAAGRYNSVSEVFRDGLRLLEQAERRRLLEEWLADHLTPRDRAKVPPDVLEKARSLIGAKIQEGLDDVASGKGLDGRKFLDRWKARLNASAKARSHPKRKG